MAAGPRLQAVPRNRPSAIACQRTPSYGAPCRQRGFDQPEGSPPWACDPTELARSVEDDTPPVARVNGVDAAERVLSEALPRHTKPHEPAPPPADRPAAGDARPDEHNRLVARKPAADAVISGRLAAAGLATSVVQTARRTSEHMGPGMSVAACCGRRNVRWLKESVGSAAHPDRTAAPAA